MPRIGFATTLTIGSKLSDVGCATVSTRSTPHSQWYWRPGQAAPNSRRILDNSATLWLHHGPIAGTASPCLSSMKRRILPTRGRSWVLRGGAASLLSLSFLRPGLPHSSNRHSFASRSEANLSHVLARSDHVFLASGVVDVCANRTQSSACWRHSLGSIGMRVVSAFRYSKEAPVRWIA